MPSDFSCMMLRLHYWRWKFVITDYHRLLPIDALATYLSHHLFTIKKIMYLPPCMHLNHRIVMIILLWDYNLQVFKLCLQQTVIIQNLLFMATSYLTQAQRKEQGWYLHVGTALWHSTLHSMNQNTVHCAIQMENGIQILLNYAIVRVTSVHKYW